jgi:hypothetical protein
LKTGFLVGGTPSRQQVAILIGAFASAVVLGPILLTLNQAATTYVDAMEVAPSLRVPVNKLAGLPKEHLVGPQARNDHQEYFAWHEPDQATGGARKFLLDAKGKPEWLVDPGINGTFAKRPDGSEVRKYDAPKALLVSYIIKGILDRKLPWELVMLGVLIAVVLELSGISSLAFAVGVYLPVSVSMGIFSGGMIRWWVDRQDRPLHVNAGLTPEQISAEGDKSPGVLMASGYIAGVPLRNRDRHFSGDSNARIGGSEKAENRIRSFEELTPICVAGSVCRPPGYSRSRRVAHPAGQVRY